MFGSIFSCGDMQVLKSDENSVTYCSLFQMETASKLGYLNCSTIRFDPYEMPLDFESKPKEPICANCSAIKPHYRCLQCKIIFYCSKTCQTLNWKNHKKNCKKTK